MARIKARCAALRADKSGSITALAAGGMVALGAVAAFAIDLGNAYLTQSELKGAANAMALAAVVDLPDTARAHATALAYAGKNLGNVRYTASDDESDEWDAAISPEEEEDAAQLTIEIGVWDASERRFTNGGDDPTAVRATVTRAVGGSPVSTFFARIFGVEALTVTASTTATQRRRACLHVLDPTAAAALSLKGNVSISMPQCGVQVNSQAVDALAANGNPELVSAGTCVAGGISLAGAVTFSPEPEADCRVEPDPLENFTPPGYGGCNHHNHRVNGARGEELTPGVYCGGLTIRGSGDVSLAPGIYVLKDGPLDITGAGSLTGDGVAFYLTGNDAAIDIRGAAEIHLKAPTSGPLKGFVIYQGPFAEPDLQSQIAGGGEIYYEGTVYLPEQHVRWRGGAVAEIPPWTLFVVKTFDLAGGGEIRAAADLAASDVPLPESFGKNRAGTQLVN